MRSDASSIEIIAHRGFSSVAPENTLAAIRRAGEAGAQAVEFDVRVASCGTPVLFHDPHLGRTTNGVGPVSRRTKTQLEALDAGSWFSDAFSGERIPTLESALKLGVSLFDRIYIEVKGYRELDDLDRMVEIAKRCGALDRSLFISLDWTVMDRLATHLEGSAMGYVVDRPERLDEALDFRSQRGGGLIDLGLEVVRSAPERVRELGDRGVPLAVWTVDEVDDAEQVISTGIRRITTNRVERLIAWSRSRATP